MTIDEARPVPRPSLKGVRAEGMSSQKEAFLEGFAPEVQTKEGFHGR